MTKIFNRYNSKPIRRKLRGEMTKGEVLLWKHIKGEQLGCQFRRQYSIGNYIVDFFCPKLKLIVEIDGFTHYDEKIFENDLKRQKYLEELGLTVKRYNSERVFDEMREVLDDLWRACDELKRRAN